MVFWVKLGVVISFLYAAAFLGYLLWRNFSFEHRLYYAHSRGDEKKGIFYALGPGLLPWAKESASRHLGVYLTGIAYHTGIGAGFAFLGISLLGFDFGHLGRLLFQVFLGGGLISGLGLLLRRIIQKSLRFISCGDDYGANLVVDLFLALALGHLFGWISEILFFVSSIVLLIYLPWGKIRHCLFFFVSRVFFGRFFGRRGVLPRQSPQPVFSGERR